jgi:hypothetical protein
MNHKPRRKKFRWLDAVVQHWLASYRDLTYSVHIVTNKLIEQYLVVHDCITKTNATPRVSEHLDGNCKSAVKKLSSFLSSCTSDS